CTKVTFSNGTSRTVVVQGIGLPAEGATQYYTHIFKGTGDDGASSVTVYLDTIAAIKDGGEEGALFVFKNGNERRLRWINEMDIRCPNNRQRLTPISPRFRR